MAATAVRISTRAVASLTSPSPSRIVSRRGGSPSRLPIAVAATASGGLTTAPTATAAAKLRFGKIDHSRVPIPKAETSTRTTESAPIVFRSRRKSITGMLTAAEYSSGGSTAARISSGSGATAGMPG